MNVQTEKIELIKLILDTENPGILNSIRKVLTKHAQKDFWQTLSQAQQDEILKGIEEIDSGETEDYEVFINRYKSSVIEQAKQYAKLKGRSLSDIVESYLLFITRDELKSEIDIAPITKSLKGSFKAFADFDYKKELEKGLSERH